MFTDMVYFPSLIEVFGMMVKLIGVSVAVDMLPIYTELDPYGLNPFGNKAVAIASEAPMVPVSVTINDTENIPPGVTFAGDTVMLEGTKLIVPVERIMKLSRLCSTCVPLKNTTVTLIGNIWEVFSIFSRLCLSYFVEATRLSLSGNRPEFHGAPGLIFPRLRHAQLCR